MTLRLGDATDVECTVADVQTFAKRRSRDARPMLAPAQIDLGQPSASSATLTSSVQCDAVQSDMLLMRSSRLRPVSVSA